MLLILPSWNLFLITLLTRACSFLLEDCWLLNNCQWSQPFSLTLEQQVKLTTAFSKIAKYVCGVCSGVAVSRSRMLLTSMPHPLGRGSKKHSWWICQRRTIYWWRRKPHHQKSNHPWDLMLLLELKFLILKTLLFLCLVSPLETEKSLLFTIASTDHSESNKTNYPTREETGWSGNGEGLPRRKQRIKALCTS